LIEAPETKNARKTETTTASLGSDFIGFVDIMAASLAVRRSKTRCRKQLDAQ